MYDGPEIGKRDDVLREALDRYFNDISPTVAAIFKYKNVKRTSFVFLFSVTIIQFPFSRYPSPNTARQDRMGLREYLTGAASPRKRNYYSVGIHVVNIS